MGWIDIKNIRMANMQCDITELIENLSLRQVLLEIVIGISREAASGSKEQETACSACFIPHLTSHPKALHQ